jgi:hypothetical protein
MNFVKIFKKQSSRVFEGIKGDVNWREGKLIDGRPNVRRGKLNLAPKNPKNLSLNQSDFSDLVKELDHPRMLAYVPRNLGPCKLPLVLEEKKQ